MSRSTKKNNKNQSSGCVEGEGEVKVVQELRRRKATYGNASSMRSLIVGSDSDLVLLALLCQCGSVFVIADRIAKHMFSTNAFDDALRRQLGADCSLAAARCDFALLALLRGNDYLPRIRGIKVSLKANSKANI